MVIFRITLLVTLIFYSSCATLSYNPSLTKDAWKDFSTSKGTPIDLNEIIEKNQATIFIWWGTQCPCVKRFQKRMESIQEKYATQGVKVFAVASNAQDSEDKVNSVAQERNFQLTIIMDKNGQLAKYYNITTTPTALLLDNKGSVQYLGWIDNERELGTKGRIAYLENALDEFLADKRIMLARGPVFGCSITRSFRCGG